MSVMSLRLPDDVANSLAHLAKATGRSKSFLAVDALKEYLAREAWQIDEIQKALTEAEAGDFAWSPIVLTRSPTAYVRDACRCCGFSIPALAACR
ncbi:ribbon-helix-helix protein, CopG family [Pseudomonas chlororaphis]|uniref:Ribbon-helix-helix protein, CopG family n=1 Tax=Pseudomonas chlororaphis TaxID=587753 RepID=A0AB34CAF3_9PSED|nr:CopG family ribbon-helix-helix protein [Pseudomonas chlororaphis]KAA5844252.1 ribbon-helix-helix protein, CopG family [Pseudomonas chlororaphis]